MKILSIVEYSLRKPLCVSFRILFSSRNVDSYHTLRSIIIAFEKKCEFSF